MTKIEIIEYNGGEKNQQQKNRNAGKTLKKLQMAGKKLKRVRKIEIMKYGGEKIKMLGRNKKNYKWQEKFKKKLK